MSFCSSEFSILFLRPYIIFFSITHSPRFRQRARSSLPRPLSISPCPEGKRDSAISAKSKKTRANEHKDDKAEDVDETRHRSTQTTEEVSVKGFRKPTIAKQSSSVRKGRHLSHDIVFEKTSKEKHRSRASAATNRDSVKEKHKTFGPTSTSSTRREHHKSHDITPDKFTVEVPKKARNSSKGKQSELEQGSPKSELKIQLSIGDANSPSSDRYVTKEQAQNPIKNDTDGHHRYRRPSASGEKSKESHHGASHAEESRNKYYLIPLLVILKIELYVDNEEMDI